MIYRFAALVSLTAGTQAFGFFGHVLDREHASANGTCGENEFKCRTEQRCIPSRWMCDGEADCVDGSDESVDTCLGHACGQDEWKCHSNHQCLPLSWLCDDSPDCDDGSDESVCTKSCTGNEFQCGNGLCIQPMWRCDGQDDCGDGSDEVSCEAPQSCKVDEFRCRDGYCIQQRYVCDGDGDCSAGEDENDCDGAESSSRPNLCQANEFRCTHQHFCVKSGWVCDGQSDCPDGSDEATEICGGKRNCTGSEFRCDSGDCIPGHLQCSGARDCRDGSDEINCGNAVESCASQSEFDCGDGKMCIPLNRTCDGRNDCGNWADEPATCRKNECEENNGGCQQICVDTATSFICQCESGYTLQNSTNCVDIDECGMPGSCSQVCLNSPGGYKCDCLPGYRKDPHHHTQCRATEGHLSLLFAHKSDIRKLSLERKAMTSIVNATRSACGLDYVFRTGMIYWSDVMEEKIYTAPIDEGWKRETVIRSSVLTADGLAADWVYSHLYWTDTASNTISMADLQGRMVAVLIRDELEEPRSIALHPALGWMFWSDWGSKPKIERAGMDGSHRQTVIEESIHWPNGITLDLVLDRIYWIDAKLNVIGSANLDGTASRVILHSKELLRHPFSLTVFEDLVYWSDWNTHTIYQANKFNGSSHKPVTSTHLREMPMTVHMYHPLRQPEFPNHCLPYNGQCSHFCVPSPRLTENSARTACVCPGDLVLDQDYQTCIKSDKHQGGRETSEAVAEKDDMSSVVAPSVERGQMWGMIIGCAAATIVFLSLIGAYFFRRRHLKRISTINFDNPVYRRGADPDPAADRVYVHRENDYIDISINETQMTMGRLAEADHHH